MKKVTEYTVDKFFNGIECTISNSKVVNYNGLTPTTDYYLFGNRIAEYDHVQDKLWISDAGRKTNTTKERLNGILWKYKLGSIFQKKGVRYYEDQTGTYEWKGEKTFSLINQL